MGPWSIIFFFDLYVNDFKSNPSGFSPKYTSKLGLVGGVCLVGLRTLPILVHTGNFKVPKRYLNVTLLQ